MQNSPIINQSMKMEPEPATGLALPCHLLPAPAPGSSFCFPRWPHASPLGTSVCPAPPPVHAPPPSSEKSCAPTWGRHMPSPLLPEARPHFRVLICFWPNTRPSLLCRAQDRRRVCRPPSPLGPRGAADKGKAWPTPARGVGLQP